MGRTGGDEAGIVPAARPRRAGNESAAVAAAFLADQHLGVDRGAELEVEHVAAHGARDAGRLAGGELAAQHLALELAVEHEVAALEPAAQHALASERDMRGLHVALDRALHVQRARRDDGLDGRRGYRAAACRTGLATGAVILPDAEHFLRSRTSSWG